jgi:Carboxylesterase family
MTMCVCLEGLFKSVIAESGVTTAPYSVHNPSDGAVNFTNYVMSVARLFDCKLPQDFNSIVNCLRLVPWRDMVSERHKVRASISSPPLSPGLPGWLARDTR